MQEKYHRAKGTRADGLLTKANDVLKNVRAMAASIRGVGTPLHKINEFILTKWSVAQGTIYVTSNNDEELISEVPDGWWFLNPATNLLLAVLVHRCNPEVIADPTNVPTGPSRETLCKESQKDTVERRERDKIVELHGSNCQRSEDSMLASKAKLMAQTVDSGTIDQVKEQLSLLSQFKDSYVKVQNCIHGQGEDDFDQETAHDLLLELPFLKKRRVGGNGSISGSSNNLADSPMTNGNLCHFVGDKMNVMYKNMRKKMSGQLFKREWEDVYVPVIGLKYSNMRCNLSKNDIRLQYFGKFKVRMISYCNISLMSIP